MEKIQKNFEQLSVDEASTDSSFRQELRFDFDEVLKSNAIKDLQSIEKSLINNAEEAFVKLFGQKETFDPVVGDWSCNIRGWLLYHLIKTQPSAEEIVHILYAINLLSINPVCEQLDQTEISAPSKPNMDEIKEKTKTTIVTQRGKKVDIKEVSLGEKKLGMLVASFKAIVAYEQYKVIKKVLEGFSDLASEKFAILLSQPLYNIANLQRIQCLSMHHQWHLTMHLCHITGCPVRLIVHRYIVHQGESTYQGITSQTFENIDQTFADQPSQNIETPNGMLEIHAISQLNLANKDQDFDFSFMGMEVFDDFKDAFASEFILRKGVLACAAVHKQYTDATQKEVDKRREKGETVFDIFQEEYDSSIAFGMRLKCSVNGASEVVKAKEETCGFNIFHACYQHQ